MIIECLCRVLQAVLPSPVQRGIASDITAEGDGSAHYAHEDAGQRIRAEGTLVATQ